LKPPEGVPQPAVLAVDDEPDLLEIYRDTLSAEGYRVMTAPDCRRAGELLSEDVFDVVISDIQLPDGNGVDLLRRVREHDLDLPVILVTGSPTVETAVKGLELGALRYLVKPVSAAELLPVVEQAVRLRRLGRLKRDAMSHLGTGLPLGGDRAGLEATFARALAGLFMSYQPIVHARGGAVYGYEALLRTREPAVPGPADFLRAAERLGQGRQLGRAVREAVAHANPAPPGVVFINLHPRDLVDEDLFAGDRPLSRMASRVVLEVTERETLDGVPDLRERARSLRRLGFRLAVDDLGAGYAGLASFAGLEPDVVKIDMSLVRGVDGEPVKRRLVASIVALCKDLGTLVVAEGIETDAEREVLVELGCDFLQGYLIGRPGPVPPRTVLPEGATGVTERRG